MNLEIKRLFIIILKNLNGIYLKLIFAFESMYYEIEEKN